VRVLAFLLILMFIPISVYSEDLSIHLSDNATVTDLEPIVERDLTIKSLERQLEESNNLTLYIGLGSIGIAVMSSIGLYFVGQWQGKKQQSENKKHTEQVVDDTADNIVQKVVDSFEADRRVGEKGGRIVYRKNKTIGADLNRSANETVEHRESVNAVVGHENGTKTIVSEHEVSHSTDSYIAEPKKRVVSEHKKTLTIDAVLITEEQKQVDDLKKEIKKYKNQLLKLTNKKPKRTTKKKTKSKK